MRLQCRQTLLIRGRTKRCILTWDLWSFSRVIVSLKTVCLGLLLPAPSATASFPRAGTSSRNCSANTEVHQPVIQSLIVARGSQHHAKRGVQSVPTKADLVNQ